MNCIQDQDVIQVLFPDCSNTPFYMDICVGCLKRVVDDMKSFRLENSIKGLEELGVIVMDQETQR
jgi:hypothetical protein